MEESRKENWKMKALCEGGLIKGENPCGNIWEISGKDLKVTTINVMGECELECIGVRCPKCGTFTELSYEDVPDDIKERALNHYYRFVKKTKRRKTFKEWLISIFG